MAGPVKNDLSSHDRCMSATAAAIVKTGARAVFIIFGFSPSLSRSRPGSMEIPSGPRGYGGVCLARGEVLSAAAAASEVAVVVAVVATIDCYNNNNIQYGLYPIFSVFKPIVVRAPRQLVFSPNLTQLTGFARRPAERLPSRRSRSLPTTTATLACYNAAACRRHRRADLPGRAAASATRPAGPVVVRRDADTASALLFSHTTSATVCAHIIVRIILLYFFIIFYNIIL